MPAPGYSAYIAPEKYAEIGRILGFGGHTEQDRRDRLFAHVDELLAEVEEPRTLADCGIKRHEFEKALPDLAKAAFMDPSIRTNPRIPMIREVIELLQAGYSGEA
jgi:acetaldehyde dehydrogenase / alcohol dehydrogenase